MSGIVVFELWQRHCVYGDSHVYLTWLSHAAVNVGGRQIMNAYETTVVPSQASRSNFFQQGTDCSYKIAFVVNVAISEFFSLLVSHPSTIQAVSIVADDNTILFDVVLGTSAVTIF